MKSLTPESLLYVLNFWLYSVVQKELNHYKRLHVHFEEGYRGIPDVKTVQKDSKFFPTLEFRKWDQFPQCYETSSHSTINSLLWCKGSKEAKHWSKFLSKLYWINWVNSGGVVSHAWVSDCTLKSESVNKNEVTDFWQCWNLRYPKLVPCLKFPNEQTLQTDF